MREASRGIGASAAPPPDRKALDDMAKRAWRREGVVILWPERLDDPWDRQHVLNLAKALYGPRRG